MLGLGNLVALRRPSSGNPQQKDAYGHLATLWSLLVAVAVWQQISHRSFAARTKTGHQQEAVDGTWTAGIDAQKAFDCLDEKLDALPAVVQAWRLTLLSGSMLSGVNEPALLAHIQHEVRNIKAKVKDLIARAREGLTSVESSLIDLMPTTTSDVIARVEGIIRDTAALTNDVSGLLSLLRLLTPATPSAAAESDATATAAQAQAVNELSKLTASLDTLLSSLRDTRDLLFTIVKAAAAAKGSLSAVARTMNTL